jgi:hypothetical protein
VAPVGKAVLQLRVGTMHLAYKYLDYKVARP